MLPLLKYRMGAMEGGGWMGVSLFLGPFVSVCTSQPKGDWLTHDIGLEEIAFFFPLGHGGGCKSCLCLCLSDPRACRCPCVHRGGQCETLKGLLWGGG